MFHFKISKKCIDLCSVVQSSIFHRTTGSEDVKRDEMKILLLHRNEKFHKFYDANFNFHQFSSPLLAAIASKHST